MAQREKTADLFAQRVRFKSPCSIADYCVVASAHAALGRPASTVTVKAGITSLNQRTPNCRVALPVPYEGTLVICDHVFDAEGTGLLNRHIAKKQLMTAVRCALR